MNDPARLAEAGQAGASAMEEAKRRRAAQQEREEAHRRAHPILSRVQAAFGPAPDTGKTWESGAIGEQQVGAFLRTLSDSVLALHDRRIPRSKANIDHMAVTPSGVWILDPKRYTGRIERRDVGGWLNSDVRLYVKGRDRTELIKKLNWQVEQVAKALDLADFPEVHVGGALWFVGAETGLFAKPFMLHRVAVTWGRKMGDVLTQPGPLSAERRHAVHRHLAQSFPIAARGSAS